KLQLEGWSRFLSGYTQDNPYSGEDEQLRREAGERMARAEASLTGGGVESRTGEMVRIELGCFMMGSPASELGRDKDERQHQVCIDEAFELGKYEVTIAEWAAEMGEITTNVCPNCAKLGVAWKDVMEFIGRLNARTGGISINTVVTNPPTSVIVASSQSDIPLSLNTTVSSPPASVMVTSSEEAIDPSSLNTVVTQPPVEVEIPVDEMK
ncbi:MAG: SUMF1/EgtB/PvdO family nonheme iron enzyme, partial [Candidatus Omnitrophica bacterium]|nr:SUMF1/EgtB/PvdO family nonheme iron enzyme [Candidatus Omnitrophota bacterium]